MKSTWFKKISPHLIAVGIFLLVSVIFCKPALDSSLTMQQSDITQWQGMSHQLIEKNKGRGTWCIMGYQYVFRYAQLPDHLPYTLEPG